ncbi:hypothetical protein [Streptomyces sp. NPDC017940]|uniref:hypothetical protein n=1 Tax=Streptomyces sp. NPDC017940 TaxID=3365017 RepID=UPI0037AC8D78
MTVERGDRMILRGNSGNSSEIPQEAAFWVPSEHEIPEDEGIGFFQDVWMILGVSPQDALAVVSTEQKYISVTDTLSSSLLLFEQISKLLESGEVGDSLEGNLYGELVKHITELPEDPDEYVSPLDGLDLGVSGLTHALSTIGGVPVASCRGHATQNPWARQPVVFAALDEERAHWLKPLLSATGCSFYVDPERSEFLAIEAPSIIESNRLAALILEKFSKRTHFERWLDLSKIGYPADHDE